MKVILNTISLDSAPELPALLTSVVGKVDGIVMVDGGSKDGTVDILQEWSTQHPDVRVACLIEPWKDDFAAQRNLCLSMTRQIFGSKADGTADDGTADDGTAADVWVLMIDTDDTLKDFDRPYLEDVVKECGVESMLVHMDNGNAPYTITQFFRLTDEVKWTNPIHEYIQCKGTKASLPAGKLTLKRGRSKRHNADPFRNIRIGRKFVEQSPCDRRGRFYLARDLFECGSAPYMQRIAEAEGHLRTYMALPGSFVDQDRLARLLLCRIMWDTGRSDEARKYMLDSLMDDPDNKSAYEALANMTDKSHSDFWGRLAEVAQGRCVLSHHAKLPQRRG